MDFLVKIFKALASEHRIHLLHILMKEGEKDISDLAKKLGLPYKTVARNLKILEQTNLVNSLRWKGLVYYSLRNEEGFEYNKALYEMIEKRYRKTQRLKRIRLKAQSRKVKA
jgi:DNA-binding transcriptional ArsR family regulator